jgi:hypothetical protein
MGGGANRLLPGVAGPEGIGGNALRTAGGHHRTVRVRLTMRIPKRHRRERAMMHPATISPLTQSVSIGINGHYPQIFNTTPTSPGCSVGSSGTTCTFAISAPPGSDTFVVSTYSATAGGGTILNSGTAVVSIVAGQANQAHVTLGPVVSSTADSGMGSLRYAIGSANPGDTIMFVTAPGATVNLATPLTLNTSVNIAGPGVTSSIRMHRNKRGLVSHTSFSGTTLSGGGSVQVFIVKAGVTATISGLIITDGSAAVSQQPGGDIYNEGNLTLSGDAITDGNSTVSSNFGKIRNSDRRRPTRHQPAQLRAHCISSNYNYGGGVYNHGSLTATGTTFDSNSVQSNVFVNCTAVHRVYGYGGGVYNDNYGTFVSSGNVYSNNSAYYGGAVYNNGTYGQASFTGDTFTANLGCAATTGCASAGCTSISSDCNAYPIGYGAAIYDANGPGVLIASSTFSNNVAGGNAGTSYGEGGALYLDTGSPLITGSTFSGNVAGGGNTNCSSGYGGAFVAYSSSLEMDNDTFTNNVAGGDDYGAGGAIYGGAIITGTNDAFTGNTAEGIGSPCDTSSGGEGGAIYQYYNVALKLSNSTFSNNNATASYYTDGGAITAAGFGTFTNDTFTSNQSVSTGVASSSSYPYAYGGAIYTYSSYSAGNLKINGSTFTSNSAMAESATGDYCYGGAIYASGSLGSTKDTFASNSATVTGSYYDSYVYGGAVYANGDFTSNGDTFQSNSGSANASANSSYGGAVYAASNNSINNATFTSNAIYSGYAYGGAIYNTSSVDTISGTFTGNIAGTGDQQGYGGAIYDAGGMSFSGTVSGNTATVAGGGLYMDTTDSIANSTISGNSVTVGAYGYGGGGIYVASSGTITNSTISGNSAVANALYTGGGGIYNDSNIFMSGSTVQGNSVTGNIGSAGGGGIYSASSGTIENSTIVGNTSTIDGGGLEQFSSSTLDLINDTFSANTASGNGGNLENYAHLYFANTIAAGGKAAAGADVDNEPSGTLNSGDYNITQTAIVNNGGTLTGTSTHNMVADPKLLALSNNGGPTQTMADQAPGTSPGSAYIPYSGGNCGPGGTGINVDQRGFTRGAAAGGTMCDVGAYEYAGVASAARPHVRVIHHRAASHHHHPKPHHPAPYRAH